MSPARRHRSAASPAPADRHPRALARTTDVPRRTETLDQARRLLPEAPVTAARLLLLARHLTAASCQFRPDLRQRAGCRHPSRLPPTRPGIAPARAHAQATT